MKLVFNEITKRKNRYALPGEAWLQEELSGFVNLAVADIVVYRQDRSNVVLEGSLQAELSGSCDRCGNSMLTRLHTSFDYLVTVEEEQNLDLHEVECSDEEAKRIHLSSPEQEIEIDAILSEQIYLALPQRMLCYDDCKGICPGCGVSLNIETCQCPPEVGGSPFAVLKNLNKN